MGSTLAEIKATMESLKGKIRSQMEVMAAELVKDWVLGRSLVRKLGRAESDWNEVENHYLHILSLMSEEEAEAGRAAHEQFQTQFFAMMGWVQDALDKIQEEEEAQEWESQKVSKLCQLG